MDTECCQVYHRPKNGEIQRMNLCKLDNSKIIWPKKAWKLHKKTCLFENEQSIEEKTIKELKTLFEFCIDFIARNAQDLESLEDFPLQIGVKIWNSLINE